MGFRVYDVWVYAVVCDFGFQVHGVGCRVSGSGLHVVPYTVAHALADPGTGAFPAIT